MRDAAAAFAGADYARLLPLAAAAAAAPAQMPPRFRMRRADAFCRRFASCQQRIRRRALMPCFYRQGHTECLRQSICRALGMPPPLLIATR